MRTLILTDIHGNMPALEAVLRSPEAASCDSVISLGDHTGFGPRPREAHERLLSLHATMLLGNHEERLNRADEPCFVGENWAFLHWTKAQMKGLDTQLPMDLRFGSVLMTHGAPGDPYRMLNEENIPPLLETLPASVRVMISGHIHTPWRVAHQDRLAINPGSTGMAEDNIGGLARFAVLDDSWDEPQVTCHAVPYDVQETIRDFILTGACDVAPEMCRVVALTFRTGRHETALNLFALAGRLKGDAVFIDRAAMEAADRVYDWPEAMDSRGWWQRRKEELT